MKHLILLLLAGLVLFGGCANTQNYTKLQKDIETVNWKVDKIAKYNLQLGQGLITPDNYAGYLADIEILCEMKGLK